MAPSKAPPKRGTKGASVKKVVLLASILSVLCMALRWNPFGENNPALGTRRLSLKLHMPGLLTRRGGGGGGDAWGRRADTLRVAAPALEDDAGAADLEGVGAEQDTHQSATAESIESAQHAEGSHDAPAAIASDHGTSGATAHTAHSTTTARGEASDEELEGAIREAMDALSHKDRARARDALMVLGPRPASMWKVGGGTAAIHRKTVAPHLIQRMTYRYRCTGANREMTGAGCRGPGAR